MAAASWLGGIGAALGHRDYRLFLLGAWASLSGAWIYYTALGWHVWELTRSGSWLGTVVLCQMATVAVLAPFTGAAADRFGARRILGIGQVLGAVAMTAMALLAYLNAMTIEIVPVLVVFNAVAVAVMVPAYFALVPNLVPREDLSSAIALQLSIAPIAGTIGAILGGLILAWWGTAAGFAGAAMCYLAMAAALLAISYRDPEREAGPFAGLPGDVAEGLRYAARRGTIRTLLLMTVAFSVLLQPVAELPPDWTFDDLGRAATGHDILLHPTGPIVLIGLLWLAWRGRTRGLARLFGATGVACGIVLGGIAATGAFGLGHALLALTAVLWLLVSATWAIGLILIQNCVDPAMRGRVIGLLALALRAVPAAGGALLAWLATLSGIAPMAAAAACLGALVGLWVLRLVRTARLDERAERPDAA